MPNLIKKSWTDPTDYRYFTAYFFKVTMFHEGIEEYAMSNTSLVSPDIQTIATDTGAQELFSPCMVGTLESQFLKLQVQVSGAKKVLDVGTFTGMSALAMAEGLSNDGKVVTIESSDDCADVAEACFKKAKHGQKVTLLRGNAVTIMKEMLKSKFELSTLIKSNQILKSRAVDRSTIQF